MEFTITQEQRNKMDRLKIGSRRKIIRSGDYSAKLVVGGFTGFVVQSLDKIDNNIRVLYAQNQQILNGKNDEGAN